MGEVLGVGVPDELETAGDSEGVVDGLDVEGEGEVVAVDGEGDVVDVGGTTIVKMSTIDDCAP